MIVILCIQCIPAQSDRTQFQHLKSSFLICWDTLLSENIIPEMLDNQIVLGPWKAVQRQGKPTGYLLHLLKEHLNADTDIPICSFLKSLDNRRRNLMKTQSAKNESELDALMGEEYTLPVKRCIQQQPDTKCRQESQDCLRY